MYFVSFNVSVCFYSNLLNSPKYMICSSPNPSEISGFERPKVTRNMEIMMNSNIYLRFGYSSLTVNVYG